MSAAIVDFDCEYRGRREPAYYSTKPVWDHDGWILPFPRTYYDKLYRQWDMSDTPFTFPEGPGEAA